MSSTALNHLTAKQLRRAAALRARIDKLQVQLTKLLRGAVGETAKPKSRRMSAAARAKIAAAQRARWAKRKAGRN
jgi:hypothetical protein